MHKVAGKQIGRDGWHAQNILWQQDDYLKLISIVMECLKNATKPFFTWDSLAEDLLSSPINMPLVNKRRNEWIIGRIYLRKFGIYKREKKTYC